MEKSIVGYFAQELSGRQLEKNKDKESSIELMSHLINLAEMILCNSIICDKLCAPGHKLPYILFVN